MNKLTILCLACMLLLIAGCDGRIAPTPARSGSDVYATYDGPIKELGTNPHPLRKRRDRMGSRDLETGIYELDDDGAPILMYRNRYPIYHPVFLAQYGLSGLEMYRTTDDEAYLELARRIAKKLQQIAYKQDGKMWFPYTFNFNLHSYGDQVMYAPWYSAMAQGQALSLFIALHEIEADDELLDASHRVFRTLLPETDLEAEPWCTCVSTEGLLWLEEYPSDPPAYTLNGMIFAIYGVYDYYQATGSEEAESVLRGSIETIRRTIPRFRIEDDYSHYCLKHPQINTRDYHMVHIEQLEFLGHITDAPEFQAMADHFKEDGEHADEHHD